MDFQLVDVVQTSCLHELQVALFGRTAEGRAVCVTVTEVPCVLGVALKPRMSVLSCSILIDELESYLGMTAVRSWQVVGRTAFALELLHPSLVGPATVFFLQQKMQVYSKKTSGVDCFMVERGARKLGWLRVPRGAPVIAFSQVAPLDRGPASALVTLYLSAESVNGILVHVTCLANAKTVCFTDMRAFGVGGPHRCKLTPYRPTLDVSTPTL